jgi:putative SOS response-associated peptidase YedK
MCGRFTLHTEKETLSGRFEVDLSGVPDLAPRYNVAPTQPVLAVRASGANEREAAWLRWGLVPHWAKDLSKLPQLINARVETVATKPSFRSSFQRQRCLILADGFYEWQPGPRKRAPKAPHFISLRGDEPFAMAGLWARWTPPEAEGVPPITSCTIITAPANAALEKIHNRMPVILRPEHEAAWLDPGLREPEQLHPLLEPVDAAALQSHPVSRDVNSPRNDSPTLIRAVEDPALGLH